MLFKGQLWYKEKMTGPKDLCYNLGYGQQDTPRDPRALVEEVTVTPESLTSLVGCSSKCLRGGPGRLSRPECDVQGLDGESKARPAGQRSSQPSGEMSRAGTETQCVV